MNKQYTVRGVDKDLDRVIRETAQEYGISVNKAAVALLRRAAGLDTPANRKGPPYHDLDELAGSLRRDEAAKLLETVKESRKIDAELWEKR